MMKLLMKICEIIGDAICKALEVAGDLAVGLLKAAAGRTNLQEVLRDSICGPAADDEQIDNTIIDMFQSLGAGGAALADKEQVLSLAEDIASSTTQKELMSAFLGDPSDDFLSIVNIIVQYEYPDMQDAFPNKEKVGNFFKNAGNLMPADFKAQMKNIVEEPTPLSLPANPSLCATPEQFEEFCELRTELLGGRATQAQIKELCDNQSQPFLRDLEDLGDILQKGIPNYISDNMPPLISDPGCDNGLMPFESDEQKATVSAVLGGDLEQLKVAFSYDMLGNGPGKKRWGLINMILSDTMGMPYTAHQRKVFNRKSWVDFYVDTSEFTEGEDGMPGSDGTVASVRKQKGAYPSEIAGHLKTQLEELSTDFASNNEIQEDVVFKKSFESLNIDRFGKNVDLLSLPDFGYNYETKVDSENEFVKFTEKARKADADVTLSFRDAGKGAAEEQDEENPFSFGFDMEFFLSDLVEDSAGNATNYALAIPGPAPVPGPAKAPTPEPGVPGRSFAPTADIKIPSDNARVKITNVFNPALDLDFAAEEYLDEDSKTDKSATANLGLIYDRKFEFLSVDDTLDGIDFSDYPDFMSTFSTKSTYMPQIVLLTEILNNNGAGTATGNVKDFHDTFMSSILATMAADVAANEAAFTYGAEFDSLNKEDVEYVVDDGQTDSSAGTGYFKATIDGENITNDDMILGISKMQSDDPDNNRVFYLDPAQYGGSYMNPPVYITPLKNEGWLGFIDVMFPELSPCKPQRTDLIDFEDVQDRIDEVYPSLPEDERLKSDPDCIVERPYERILERPSVAAIEGLITAAIRIFVSVHFVKAMATFTKFYPKFTETYSSLFAQYIIEDMERSFKDAQKAFWEFFNPFKDSEFWYAFLEQSVQTYARRIDKEGTTPPINVYNALVYLSETAKKYDYPYREDLKEAKDLREVSRLKTLKNYRSNQNLEFVQKTEEYAKLILKELVNEQLNYMGEKFMENLEVVGMAPDIYDLDYYVMSEAFTQGSTISIIGSGSIKEEVVSLPTSGSELYTYGSEFSNTETGEMYTGYYHVDTDEAGNIYYMAGEEHTEEDHDTLRPLADQVIVPIGTVQDYGEGASVSTTQPFLIEKYISINGTKYSSDDALDKIKGEDPESLVTEIYPGTLEKVTDAAGKVVGLTGELGVRYGLEFSVVMNGTAYPVTSVEVDALDTVLSQVPPFEGNSKLLLCLINMLKEDETYRLVAQYIFPMKKMTALLAIYNSEGFLPSIGELTVETGESFGSSATDIDAKPGMKVEVDSEGIATSAAAEEGWANIADRSGRFTPFVQTFDEWDQVLLRSSKSRLKKLFRSHYNSRDFDPADLAGDKASKVVLNSLRESFRFPAGMQLLPWWKRRMVSTNPFDSKGALCEKED